MHADDTLVIISTGEDLLIRKCNVVLYYFCRNKLNFGKSGYILTVEKNKKKTNHVINNGYIKYKNVIKYLSTVFSPINALGVYLIFEIFRGVYWRGALNRGAFIKKTKKTHKKCLKTVLKV